MQIVPHSDPRPGRGPVPRAWPLSRIQLCDAGVVLGDSSVPYVGVSPEPSWIPPGPVARTMLLADILPERRLRVGSGLFPPLGKEGVGQKEVYVGRGVVAIL